MAIQYPRIGETFLDRYEIKEVLGAGGMSRVYGAVQTGLDRQVAIKLLSPAGADDLTQSQLDNVAARFEREAKLISRFRSPHTVVMYDYGRSEEHLFMILEYVDGVHIADLVDREGALPIERVVRLLRQVLSSLAEAHEMGILHRDIKPQNIMVYEHLGDPDNAKVLDFGIAKTMSEAEVSDRQKEKLTEERTIVGTPSYMAPEQILGNELSAAADIYSLGLVAYEMLFGVVAVEANSAVSTMARHLQPDPIEIPANSLPVGFVDVLKKMIAKDSSARYQSAGDVMGELEPWAGAHPSLTVPPITPSSMNLTNSNQLRPVVRATEEAEVASNSKLAGTAALLLTAVVMMALFVGGLVWMMSSAPATGPGEVTNSAPPAPPVVAQPAAPAAVPPAIEPLLVAEQAPEPEQPEEVGVAEAAPAPKPARNVKKKPTKAAVKKAPPTEKKVEEVAPPAEEEVAAPAEAEAEAEVAAVAAAEEKTPAEEPTESAVPPARFDPRPAVNARTVESKKKKKKKIEKKPVKKAVKKPKKDKAPPLSF